MPTYLQDRAAFSQRVREHIQEVRERSGACCTCPKYRTLSQSFGPIRLFTGKRPVYLPLLGARNRLWPRHPFLHQSSRFDSRTVRTANIGLLEFPHRHALTRDVFPVLQDLNSMGFALVSYTVNQVLDSQG